MRQILEQEVTEGTELVEDQHMLSASEKTTHSSSTNFLI
jgi:hypothetical protein